MEMDGRAKGDERSNAESWWRLRLLGFDLGEIDTSLGEIRPLDRGKKTCNTALISSVGVAENSAAASAPIRPLGHRQRREDLVDQMRRGRGMRRALHKGRTN
jgi:hypothetical protein